MPDNNMINHIQNALPNKIVLDSMHKILSAMANPTRLKILLSLAEGELCVNDLASILDMSQSAISHQLYILRNSHCVKSRRLGRQIFYSLDDEHVKEILSVVSTHAYHL